MHRVKKPGRLGVLQKLAAALAALFVFTMLAWVAVAGPETVWRILRRGDTQIDDFRQNPGRELVPSLSPLPFPQFQSDAPLPAGALGAVGGQDLDTILEANETIAFLVVQDGAIRYERYYQGHTASSISQIFSVSKSITSALIGMAIDDGLIAGVEQPIIDFIPELAERGFDRVSLHHALTMMSGSSYVENDNPFGEHVILNYTPRLEARILDFEMETQPGTVYRYKSGDNALLGLALTRALAPETIKDYAQRRMWGPLGMEDRGIWSTDRQEGGLERTWCCLALSGRDLAKIGQLFLEGGNLQNEQVLSARWVQQSTQVAQVPAGAWPEDFKAIGWRNYGYHWWLATEREGDFFGLGKDGQFLYVNPSTGTVIVRLGWTSGEMLSSQWISLFQAIAGALEGGP